VKSIAQRTTFARRVFLVAGVYGLLILLPHYFMEGKIGIDNPPAITHPEYFYGFVGVGVAWQILFLLIARNPTRYRIAMVPAVLEKLAFGGAALVLHLQHRLALQVLVFGVVDLVFAVLFISAFVATPISGGESVTR
jgi:hypothetical protein